MVDIFRCIHEAEVVANSRKIPRNNTYTCEVTPDTLEWFEVEVKSGVLVQSCLPPENLIAADFRTAENFAHNVHFGNVTSQVDFFLIKD